MSTIVKIIKDQNIYNKEELLYISSPKELLFLVKDLNLEALYNPAVLLDPIGDSKSASAKRMTEVQKIKLAYNLQKNMDTEEEYKELMTGVMDPKIKAREIVVYPFLYQYKGKEEGLLQRKNMERLSIDLPQGSITDEMRNILILYTL